MENRNNISISKNAAEKIKIIISSQEKGLILKISVLGGDVGQFGSPRVLEQLESKVKKR